MTIEKNPDRIRHTRKIKAKDGSTRDAHIEVDSAEEYCRFRDLADRSVKHEDDLEKVMEDDRRWFRKHSNKDLRIRKYTEIERKILPDDAEYVLVVRTTIRGTRARLPLARECTDLANMPKVRRDPYGIMLLAVFATPLGAISPDGKILPPRNRGLFERAMAERNG